MSGEGVCGLLGSVKSDLLRFRLYKLTLIVVL